MLARDLISAFNQTENYCFDRLSLDITDSQSVTAALFQIRPDFVINCAAFTQVDACEKSSACYLVNALGVHNLVRACKKVKAKLVHISSDYVFSGMKVNGFYKEDDGREPINHYGRSKLLGELALESSSEDWLMVRVQWLFGVHGINFVNKIRMLAETKSQLKVVADQFGRPTNTVFLAQAVKQLVMNGAKGTYNLGSTGHCSWYDLAAEIVRLTKKDVVVTPCSSEEYPMLAPRPKNAVLDVTKALLSNVSLHPWQDHVGLYLHNA